MKPTAIALTLLLVAGCQPGSDTPPARSTAMLATDIRSGAPLDEILHQLDRELIAAHTGRMEGEALNHFLRAEAISDRLLEARAPFEWISSEQYSLEARLRQIQSGADRVLAQVQTGAPLDTMLGDLEHLRRDVLRLRQLLASGGGRAPPPLRQLLADTQRPAPRPTPRPTAPAAPDTVAAR